MKLTDAPKDVRDSLRLVRQVFRSKAHRTPANGELWFGPADAEAFGGIPCAICGEFGMGERLQNDHCHVTGIWRGYLCRSCNHSEGRSNASRFDWWMLYAPGITGERILHGPEGLFNGFTRDELAHSPMADLLDDRRARHLSGPLNAMWREWSYYQHGLAEHTRKSERAA
jgi:hypothetical protein